MFISRSQLFLFALLFLVGSSSFAQKKGQGGSMQSVSKKKDGVVRCAAMEVYQRQMKNDPDFQRRRQRIQEHVQNYRQQHPHGRSGRSVITIPVVFHVVHNNASENISDPQIMSQLEILNEDFRRLNSDTGDTRSQFDTVAADSEIEFCLAVRAPDGTPTSGITRTSTSHGPFGTGDDVKFTAQGGKDAWPASDYLNFWICDLSGGLLGYAQFPGGNPATDGVVVNYANVGDTLNVSAPYDLGRTGTHEVGHWLDLYHTFQGGCAGTTPSTCSSAGDRCCDTPPVQTPSSGCPPNTQNTCSETPDRVDQWENYMDYTEDACMNMFSLDQKGRMQALFAPGGARESLLSSNACVPVNSWDVAISDILVPNGGLCQTDLDPEIVLSNVGSNQLNSVDIEYAIDGSGTQTYSWTGTLNGGESDTITLPTMSASPGSHSFTAYTLPNSLNGSQNDQYTPNDSATSSFNVVIGGTNVNVTVETDCWGSEVSWELVDNNGNVLGNGGPWTNQVATHTKTIACLDSGCYEFKIYDAYGDGMYGSQWGDCSVNGDFYLLDDQGDTLTQMTTPNAAYGDSSVKSFCLTLDDDSAQIDFIDVNDVSCNGAADGSITIHPSGSDFEYSNDNGSSFQYSNVFSGLAPGTYDLILQDTATGNADSAQVTVGQPSVLTLDSVNTSDPTCGDANGSLEIHASGGTTPYDHSIDNGSSFQSSNSFSGLGPGNYDIVVEDDNGCSVNGTVTLTNIPGPTDMSFDGSPETCSDGNGAITITNVTGGTPPYQYDFDGSGYSTQTSYNNLSSGTYTVTVQDGNGCTYSEDTSIVDLAGPSGLQVNSTSDTCRQSIGAITVTGVTGGIPPFEYSFDGGPWTSDTSFNDLSEGTYTVVVRDTNDCKDSVDVNVGHVNAPTVSLDSLVHPACAGESSGSISVDVSGVTGPYNYQWDDPQGQTGTQATGLSEGVYTVTVTDASGCTASYTNTLEAPEPLDISVETEQAICEGIEDGSISSTVSGGTPPYSYDWSNGMSGSTISGVPAGSYDLAVTDANGCISNANNVSVGVATDLVLELTAENEECGLGNGKVKSELSGGAAPYTYEWGIGSKRKEISGLMAGTYELVVTDSNGCQESRSAEVRDTITEKCLDIPNVITPNGDGINDRWNIEPLQIYEKIEVKVFDRWGSLVYETDDPMDKWDGTRAGQKLPEASYHYIIVVNGGEKKLNGPISIVR